MKVIWWKLLSHEQYDTDGHAILDSHAIYWKYRSLRKGERRGFLHPEGKPLPFCIPFFTKNVPLSYTFFWQMVPLPHTLFRTLYPFYCSKCTGNNHKNRALSRLNKAISFICQPFWALYRHKLQISLPFYTSTSEIPTLSYTWSLKGEFPGYGAVEGGNSLRKLKEAYARRKTKIKPLKETNLGLAPKGDRIQNLYR